MEYSDIQNVKNQVPVLIGNLKNKGDFGDFEILQQLRLTIPALIKFNLKEELESIKPELLSFTQVEKDNHPYNTPLHVYELVASCKNAFSKDETGKYIEILESRFEKDCTIIPGSNDFDLHSIIEMGKALSLFRFKQSAFDDVDRILNAAIGCIENSDKDMPGLRSVGIYRDIIRLASNMGRQTVLDRLSAILEKNAPNVHKDMGKIETSISIPQDVVDKDLDSMVNGHTLDETLTIFAMRYVPTNNQIEDYKRKFQEQNSILSAFTHLYFTTGGMLSHEVRPGTEYKKEQEDQMYSTALSYLTVAMHLIIITGQRRGIFTVDNIMNFISKSPILTPRRVSIIEKGIYAYMEYDYISAISILVPQIEFMVRAFYAHNGYPVTTNDYIGTTSDALGTLLNNDEIIILDWDITRYLRTILSNRTGWNLRNLYCHGIDDSFSIIHADRVFHILLLMAVLSQSIQPDSPQ